jgi:hypothetical protein
VAKQDTATPGRIEGQVSRDDLEAKFRELRGEIDDTAESAKSYAAVVIAAGAVVALGVVFWLGKRSAKKTTTVVEVRRL